MSLKKQIKLFCASTGSSNFDHNDNFDQHKLRLDIHDKLNNKECKRDIKLTKIFSLHSNPIMTRSSEIFNETKLVQSQIRNFEAQTNCKNPKSEASIYSSRLFHVLQFENQDGNNISQLLTEKSLYLTENLQQSYSGSLSDTFQVQTISDVIFIAQL